MMVWIPGCWFLTGWVWKILSAVLMICAAYAGMANTRLLLRIGLLFAAVSFLLAGVVLALGMLTGAPGADGGIPYIPVDFRVLFLTAAISYVILTLAFRHSARHGAASRAEVNLEWGGRCVTVTALLDSGHTLCDPVSGAEVLLIESYTAKQLLPETVRGFFEPGLLRNPAGFMELLYELKLASGFYLLPYRSVGVETGLLLAFKPDKVTVGGKARKGSLVAISPTPIEAGEGIRALASVN